MFNRLALEQDVRRNTLPFWQGLADMENGGFYGEADFYGVPVRDANKGCIMHSRILWTFSAAYRLFKEEAYRVCADRARAFLIDAFWDGEYGGLYWMVDASGKPLETKKQFYNIAFGIYALSEHYRATGDGDSLKRALALFDVTEAHGRDPVSGGYVEGRDREWKNLDYYHLGPKDLDTPKSMNTNLHVMEAYTNLLRACESASHENTLCVRKALEALTVLTIEKIINPSHHFELYFDMDWNTLTKEISYGHDIEGSWLLYDAGLALGGAWAGTVKKTAVDIAEVIYATAIDKDSGGLISGINTNGVVLVKKEWWPQAEAVVGFYNAWELSGELKYRDAAEQIADFAAQYFIDREHGDWHNELKPGNIPDPAMPKAGFWKCPYHNSRMYFQLCERLD